MKLNGLFSRPTIITSLILIAASIVLFVNITEFQSSIVGFVSSVVYLYICSVLCGNIFWKGEFSWRKILFGFSILVVLISLGCSLAIMLHGLSARVVGTILVFLASALILLNLKRQGLRKTASESKIADDKRQQFYVGLSKRHILQVLYVGLAALSFFALFISRSEETFSIWDVVNPLFLPALFASTFVLLILLFSETSDSAKISLIVVHSILIHSVLAIVLNPGWRGDVWRELGRIRDIVTFGNDIPTAFEFAELQYSPYQILYYSLRKRAFQVLVRVFATMFGTDIYRSQIILVPTLWGILTPFFMYEIVKMMGGKGYSRILSAFLPLSVSMLIWVGAVGLPDALSPVFFGLTLFLVLSYLFSKEKSFFLIIQCFMGVAVSLMVHFKTGIICMSFFLLAFSLKAYWTSEKSVISKVMVALSIIISTSLLPIGLFALYGVYPEAGYMHVQFNLNKLISTGPMELIFGEYVNFSTTKLLLFGLIPFLGIIGIFYVLVFSPKRRYNRSLCLFLVLAELILLLNYRVLKYGMDNIPFTPERIWNLRDLLFIPFGAILIDSLIRKVHSLTPRGLPQLRIVFRRFKSGFSVIVLILCVLLSSFVVEATTDAYTNKPILNPTSYEVDAIWHIQRTTQERYVVIGDPVFTYLAWGIFGMRYQQTFTRIPYSAMYANPSVEVMENALHAYRASVGYFVVSIRYQKFSSVVAKAMEIFDIYAIFGEGNLYVFRYPRIERDYIIPIKVDAGNYSRTNYVIEYELNWTQVLFGMASMHLDPNSISVIDQNNKEVPSQLVNFQTMFENSSSSENWSAGSSDGDVLTYSIDFIDETELEAGTLVYNKFEADGGDLVIESQKYQYMEMKWKVDYETVANIRFTFLYKTGNGTELITAWAHPSAVWSIFRLAYPKVGETLYGLRIQVFEASPYDWDGVKLYIDWMRFVSDAGVMRWLYNGTAGTESQYKIAFDFLENTESGAKDHLTERSYFEETSSGNDMNPPPSVSTWVPVGLSVTTVDSLDQRLGDVTVSFPELEINVNTDENGWVDVAVPQGKWTVVVSKDGLVYERNIEILANSVIRQRLDFVQIDELVLNTLHFVVFISLMVIVCLFTVLFFHKKYSRHSIQKLESDVVPASI